MTILYEDKYIVCDDNALTINYYYFPVGSKRIPYNKINDIKQEKMTFWTGGSRIWGGTWDYWLNLDPSLCYQSFNPSSFSPKSVRIAESYLSRSQFLGSPGKA